MAHESANLESGGVNTNGAKSTVPEAGQHREKLQGGPNAK